MLCVYFLQQWYALADEALEDAIYDSQAMRDFIGIDLAVESVPDATTLLRFRHLLEKHALTQWIFEEINASLVEQGLFMREDTIVDATIVAGRPLYQEPGSRSCVAAKRGAIKKMDDRPLKTLRQAIEKTKASIRAKVEHPFHVIKNLFDYRKVRDKGLAKNQAQLFSLFALANLVLAKRCEGRVDRVSTS